MNLDAVSMILNSGIEVVIYGSMPSIGAGLLVGLLIAVFQAVTQIQEQTLTFVPKMLTVFVVLAATFPWMANMLIELSLSLWKNIPFYAQ